MDALRSSSESGGAGRSGLLLTRSAVVFGLALALTAGGCYDPQIEDGHLTCAGADRQCPRGFHCAMACNLCYHGPSSLENECNIDIVGGADGGGTAGGSGQGVGGFYGGGAGGGAGQNGAGGGPVVGGGGASGTAGVNGGGGAMVGSGGHGGTIVGGSGGTPGGAGGMNGAAGAIGTGGHVGAGGTTGAGGLTGSGGATGVGGKTGVGGAMMGTGGAAGLGLGSACSVGTQCATGLCVDKVCCNSACAGQCQACDIASNPGTCLPVTSGPPHGTRAACGGTGVCAGQCALTTATAAACVFAPTSVSCALASCSGSTLTAARFCDALGTCSAAASGPCPLGLNCNAAQNACLASCTTSADCIATAPNCNLSTHQCTTARPIGSTCSVDGDCQNGLCVDGFCCSDVCTSQCMACDVSGHQGQCTPVPAGQQPHGARGACGGSAECQGSCSGSSPSCQFPGSGTTCVCPGLVPMTGTCNMAGGCLLLGLLCL